MELKDLSNNINKNLPSDDLYKKFNDFIFSNDLKLIGKLLHRFEYFLKTKHLPGDIVEIGVFKGSGIATFLKFIDIYCPNSNKKILGFDIFDTDEAKEILKKDSDIDNQSMGFVYNRLENINELTLESVHKRIKETKLSEEKFNLIKGDVEITLKTFLEENPGFRISLLYIDVDLERPTYFTLKYLWDRILPGGYILFDEYDYHKFSESNGVEKFFKERNIEFNVETTNWIAPTAFIRKKSL